MKGLTGVICIIISCICVGYMFINLIDILPTEKFVQISGLFLLSVFFLLIGKDLILD